MSSQFATAIRLAVLGCLMIPLAACQSVDTSALASGDAAYQAIPVASPGSQRESYRIGPLDRINISVFMEPDLSMENVQVDASGNVLMPLIGELVAEGKTTRELSEEIATRLGARFVVNPQVTVAVSSSVSQTVTVEGSVTEPGVYELNGPSTLLSALARAKSPTRTAALDQVVVFRTVNGERMGAVFNLQAIRTGQAPDPQILGGDTVVVGYSFLKGAFRDFLQAAPAIGIFSRF